MVPLRYTILRLNRNLDAAQKSAVATSSLSLSFSFRNHPKPAQFTEKYEYGVQVAEKKRKEKTAPTR